MESDTPTAIRFSVVVEIAPSHAILTSAVTVVSDAGAST